MAARDLPELAPGESPFDRWERENLVRFAQRCYAAMRASQVAMGLLQLRNDPGGFWGLGGTGGRAFALTEAVVREVGYDTDRGSPEAENLYRAFYRTYMSVLFADAVAPNGEPYFTERYVCDVCGQWAQPGTDKWIDRAWGREAETEPQFWWHARPRCPGVFRVMGVEDLPPIPPEPG